MDCKSKEDVKALAEALEATNNPQGMAAMLMAAGMMKAQWWLHAVVRFICWRHDISPQQAWGIVFAKYPAEASLLIEAAADWIVTGKDKDGEGVGGFNQREVDTLTYALVRQIEREAVA